MGVAAGQVSRARLQRLPVVARGAGVQVAPAEHGERLPASPAQESDLVPAQCTSTGS